MKNISDQISQYLSLVQSLEEIYNKELSMIDNGKFSTLENLVAEKEQLCAKLIMCQEYIVKNTEQLNELTNCQRKNFIEKTKKFSKKSEENFIHINALSEFSETIAKHITCKREAVIEKRTQYNQTGKKNKIPKDESVYVDNRI